MRILRIRPAKKKIEKESLGVFGDGLSRMIREPSLVDNPSSTINGSRVPISSVRGKLPLCTNERSCSYMEVSKIETY